MTFTTRILISCSVPVLRLKSPRKTRAIFIAGYKGNPRSSSHVIRRPWFGRVFRWWLRDVSSRLRSGVLHWTNRFPVGWHRHIAGIFLKPKIIHKSKPWKPITPSKLTPKKTRFVSLVEISTNGIASISAHSLANLMNFGSCLDRLNLLNTRFLAVR